jgi:hypothetical protein
MNARIAKRKRALQKVNSLHEKRDHVLVVHYSCESFFDRPDGLSPRTTSIAVLHLSSRQTSSFSLHLVAEREGLSLETASKVELDSIEKKMLSEFFDLVKSRDRHLWLHWNMRDSTYGFQALVQRARVLSISAGKCVPPNDDRLYDLSNIIHDIYSSRYAEHPRLAKLIEQNGFSTRNFLSGADEAAAYENKEFVNLHYSTLAKVNIFSKILECQIDETLKTRARRRDIFGNRGAWFVMAARDHWVITLIGVAVTLLSAWDLVAKLFDGAAAPPS